MTMIRLSCGIFAAVQLAVTWTAFAQTGSGPAADHQVPVIRANMNQTKVLDKDGSTAAITISARNLDFGAVPVGSNHELSFKIQNVGAGHLTGTASVLPPFSIVGGSAFVLEPAQTQVITVQYSPKSLGMHITVVHLTGASVTVAGSATPPLSKAPARRRRTPTQPDGQRLIARY